jgi:phosphatidylglycerol lysyltransferase
MEHLFLELIVWAKEQGFRRFDLGMAPLAGLENRKLAPLWSRAGALIFQYGEDFYNFEGLRRFKEKFKPVWEPRYLAAPGGLSLPAVLADVTFLVGGGVGAVMGRQSPRPAPLGTQAA